MSNTAGTSTLNIPTNNESNKNTATTTTTTTTTNKIFMRPAVLLTDMSDSNLRLVSQCGATDIVAPCPGFEPGEIQTLVDRIASFGMRLSVIERFVPHDQIVHDLQGRDEQISNIKKLIRSMGKAGVEVLCYNWMPNDDWTRTDIEIQDRGGALVTAFDINKRPVHVSGNKGGSSSVTSREKLWDTLRRFLEEVIPVCEESGVLLALHPDDPPLSELNDGQPQIVYSIDEISRVVNLVQSPANGICFCQGTFASGGEAINIPNAIRRLGDSIKFVHFRNVVYEGEGKFRETWQDTGDIDCYEAMKAYYDIGFRGVIRPDHVPTLEGEDNSDPGYHVLGRLFALGYIRGLMESVVSSE